MTASLAPYSAVLVASYGGPNGPEDVLPFMRNATRGRGIPDERLMEVAEHYMLFGGKSPINERNAELMAAIDAELRRRDAQVPVVIGNRNWEPYLNDTVASLVDQGHQRVVALATSAYQSYSSCRQYCEDLAGAGAGQPIVIDKLDPFWDAPEFAQAQARALVEGVRALSQRIPEGRIRVLFVTHSIPLSMNERSADGRPDHRYDAQHRLVAERAAASAAETLGTPLVWEIAYCSRSGPPHVPWLEPDVGDRLPEIADEVEGVVVVPFGFISDHMEVVYDLDTEARAIAEELGLGYERAATVGEDAGVVAMLVDRLLEQAALARQDRPVSRLCQLASDACCLPSPRPGQHGHHDARAPKKEM